MQFQLCFGIEKVNAEWNGGSSLNNHVTWDEHHLVSGGGNLDGPLRNRQLNKRSYSITRFYETRRKQSGVI